RVSDETPRPIREINPDAPEALCRVIERLQAKKPADRFGSAREVADLLAGLLADLNHGRSRLPDGILTAQDADGHGRSRLPDGTLTPPAPARRAGPTRRWRWAAAALVLLCIGLGLSEATGVTNVRSAVIRLFSPEGTLVVEVDDPGVSVRVDGGEVVITGAGAKEIRLKPGQYKVVASRDGKVVQQELVTVDRDGRRVVRISAESAPLSEAERWERTVAAMSAEQQVRAVVRRLKELNPAFDGTVTPTIENGAVTGLKFLTDDVD